MKKNPIGISIRSQCFPGHGGVHAHNKYYLQRKWRHPGSAPPDQSHDGNRRTYLANGLANGTTSATGTVPGSMARMDNLDINDLATGFNNTIKTVMFGGILFTNVNGTLPDFFIFEGAGTGSGNPDDISIAAIFPDDSLGASVVAPTSIASPNGWGNTGVTIGPGAPQSGQVVAGLCWDITDLKDAGGAALASTTVIKGIAITAGFGIDPLAFLANVPPILVDHFAVTTSWLRPTWATCLMSPSPRKTAPTRP